ncbi:hypothetical protein NL676_005642 [Syzygium grande]|nr:hypothetical protein NL676_005642 [Syzygium grande]
MAMREGWLDHEPPDLPVMSSAASNDTKGWTENDRRWRFEVARPWMVDDYELQRLRWWLVWSAPSSRGRHDCGHI